MKKLDRLLLISFIPPFLVTFGIATFVLLMQILWVYIDDIAGKGLSMLMIFELLSYKAVGLVPMALPLAILISGVMVMGGLAERYELSSFKSAGISLLRVMQPIILFGLGAAILSYLCNDYIIPKANLNFGSRMYDIREKKPTLSLEAGVFNDDFGNFSIRVGEKGSDGRSIKDVLIYDHTNVNSGKLSQVIAESGEMFSTPDGGYFVMQLQHGHQYMESRPSARNQGKGYPFIRTSFDSWNKVFDLSEFQLEVTDADLFSQNRSMMSISQLADRIDTIQLQIDKREYKLAEQVSAYFVLLNADTLLAKASADSLTIDSSMVDATESAFTEVEDSVATQESDTLAGQRVSVDSVKLPVDKQQHSEVRSPEEERKKLLALRAAALNDREKEPTSSQTPPVQQDKAIYHFTDTLPDVKAWIESLGPTERRRYLTKAKSQARAILSQAESAEVTLNRTREDKVKHIYELHTKYSMAVVCIIFVFIGAPLGAIVRKGGFGFPLLISTVAFIIFIVLTIFCRKIAETFIVPAAMAAWLPCLILAPIGLWLTLAAMRGNKLINISIPQSWKTFLQKMRPVQAKEM